MSIEATFSHQLGVSLTVCEMSEERRTIAVALGSPELQTTSVSVASSGADFVVVAYKGLPGNQPYSYDNFVAIWESSVIPWKAKPLKQVPIVRNSESGDVLIDGLIISTNSYIIGYSVGPKVGNISASAILQAVGLLAAPTHVQIGLESIGTDSVLVSYRTLSGYRPKTYKNWIGLWKGYASPYAAPDPEGTAYIESDASEGTISINPVSISINTTYSLIYFVGPKSTQAAAILTFDTSDHDGA